MDASVQLHIWQWDSWCPERLTPSAAPEALVHLPAWPICGTHEKHRPLGAVGAKECWHSRGILSINASISMHTRSAWPISSCPYPWVWQVGCTIHKVPEQL